MFLEIRDIKQNSFKICVKLSDTIIDVKEKIKMKIPILDIDDQMLVYSGNILANDRTVDECEIGKNDYVTLIYNSMIKNEVCESIEKARNELKIVDSKNSSEMCQEDGSTFSFTDDDSKSIKTSSRNTSEELDSNGDQIMYTDDSDSEDLSHYTLLESIPDVKKLCEVIGNDPMELHKILSKLSHQGSFVFEKILENQHAYIDLLNSEEFSSDENQIKQLETKDYEAIDRLMKKGYPNEMVLQVYRVCDFDEIGAAELLKCLH